MFARLKPSALPVLGATGTTAAPTARFSNLLQYYAPALVILLLCAVGCGYAYQRGHDAGLLSGAELAKVNARAEALPIARKELNAVMTKHCVSWFTDKRYAKKAGDTVLCKAPAFIFEKDK
jgi:hypothetical protein